jgi:hypothetical protein
MRFLIVAASLGALSLTTLPQRLAAQAVAENAAYLELGGSAGLFSVNYERRISAARLRVGIAQWTVADLFGIGSDSYTVLPITVSSVRGDGKHHLESGGGISLGLSTMTDGFDGSKTSNTFTTLTAIAGYRYQKPGSGFLFRAVLTPMYGLGSEELAYPASGFFLSAGISFGAAF